jgi:hypothetical protein
MEEVEEEEFGVVRSGVRSLTLMLALLYVEVLLIYTANTGSWPRNAVLYDTVILQQALNYSRLPRDTR